MKYIYSTLFFIAFLFFITSVIDFNYVQEVENIDMDGNNISQIQIDVNEANVSLATTVDKDIKIEHIYSKEDQPTSNLYTYQDGSTLYINEYPYNHSNLISKKETINVYIPEEYQFDTLNIVSGTGQVNIDSLSVGDLSIDSQTGNVDIANVTAEQVNITGGKFGINITNLISKSINTDVVKSQLTITNSIADEFTFISKEQSNVYITKLVAPVINVLNKKGSVELVLSDSLDHQINTSAIIGNSSFEKSATGYIYKQNNQEQEIVYNLTETSNVSVTLETTKVSKDE